MTTEELKVLFDAVAIIRHHAGAINDAACRLAFATGKCALAEKLDGGVSGLAKLADDLEERANAVGARKLLGNQQGCQPIS